MRAHILWTLAVTSAALSGCADDAPVPPARAAGAVAPPQSAPNDALLARLRPDDPAFLQAAQAIAMSRDPVTLRAASARLMMEAQAARSAQAIAQLLPAMAAIGGPDVVAYCLWLGENEAAPLDLRKGALAVLSRWADRNDPVVRARGAHIWERVNALSSSSPAAVPSSGPAVPSSGQAGAPPAAGPVPGQRDAVSIGGATIRGGTVANANGVINGMAGDFRRCYSLARQENPATHGTLRVTLKVEANGGVVVEDESHEGLTSNLVSCVITRVQAATFSPPQGGPATVVIPIAFDAKP